MENVFDVVRAENFHTVVEVGLHRSVIPSLKMAVEQTLPMVPAHVEHLAKIKDLLELEIRNLPVGSFAYVLADRVKPRGQFTHLTFLRS
ncbi:hypothetical protein N183_11920 [Sinorhizobium sp. Sb3]|nr:hypothetical protein N183_11920 [Sinorhizobium sp. Sb3]